MRPTRRRCVAVWPRPHRGGGRPTTASRRVSGDGQDRLARQPALLQGGLALALPAADRPGHRTVAAREAESARREAVDLDVAPPSGEGPRPAVPDFRLQGRYWQTRAAGRVAVVEHFRRALHRIAAVDREVADLIASSVHTGRYCVYLPVDPR
jgi:hypothetical protein